MGARLLFSLDIHNITSILRIEKVSMMKSYIIMSAIALIGVFASSALAQPKGRNDVGKESFDLLENFREVPMKSRMHYVEREDETLVPRRWGGNWPKGVK